MDARSAYGARLARLIRYVVFLKPDIVVLVDDVRSAEPVQLAWLLHPQGDATVDGTRWTAVNGAARLDVDVIGHETFGRGDGYRVSLADRETFYHDRDDMPVRQLNRVASFETLHATTEWLVPAVLRVSDADAPERPLQASVERTASTVVVLIREPETWTVTCDLDARTVSVKR